MTLAALTRWDYPQFDAGGEVITGGDVAASVENQPLGLLFQFAGPVAELMLALESDAEQVTYEVSPAGGPQLTNRRTSALPRRYYPARS